MIEVEQLNKIIKQHCPDGDTFVEIGAYDGESYCNTVHLADSGWKGYYFEPVLEYAIKCRERHKNNKVSVLPVAIGKQGIKQIFVSEMLSTFKDNKYREKVNNLKWFKDRGTIYEERDVVIMSPSIIPKCDLLVIDVEGTEYDIIKLMKITPKILMIELHEDSIEWQSILKTTKIIKLLNSLGYDKVYSDDVDSIFIHK